MIVSTEFGSKQSHEIGPSLSSNETLVEERSYYGLLEASIKHCQQFFLVLKWQEPVFDLIWLLSFKLKIGVKKNLKRY